MISITKQRDNSICIMWGKHGCLHLWTCGHFDGPKRLDTPPCKHEQISHGMLGISAGTTNIMGHIVLWECGHMDSHKGTDSKCNGECKECLSSMSARTG